MRTTRDTRHATRRQIAKVFRLSSLPAISTPDSSFLTPNCPSSLLPSSLSPLPCQRERRVAAFTLIETALAMLAIGLGLVALFGLGRLGLRSTKETDHDQRCALMADAVFETLREANARFVDEARTNRFQQSWSTRWVNAIGTANQIPFPPVADLCTSRVPAPTEPLYLTFNQALASAYLQNDLLLTEWNPRYTLSLGPKYDASHVAGDQNLLQATLVIYPDGDTYSSEHRIFQTTLSNPGGLP